MLFSNNYCILLGNTPFKNAIASFFLQNVLKKQIFIQVWFVVFVLFMSENMGKGTKFDAK